MPTVAPRGIRVAASSALMILRRSSAHRIRSRLAMTASFSPGVLGFLPPVRRAQVVEVAGPHQRLGVAESLAEQFPQQLDQLRDRPRDLPGRPVLAADVRAGREVAHQIPEEADVAALLRQRERAPAQLLRRQRVQRWGGHGREGNRASGLSGGRGTRQARSRASASTTSTTAATTPRAPVTASPRNAGLSRSGTVNPSSAAYTPTNRAPVSDDAFASAARRATIRGGIGRPLPRSRARTEVAW